MADPLDLKPASASHSELIRWMSIQDANSAGFIHGGTVMRMCDEAAGIAAIRHCGKRVVTAGMDRMTFTEAVYVGELLRCSASVNAVWKTSMEVGVRVEAENAVTGEVRHTLTAYLTMVCVDESGKPHARAARRDRGPRRGAPAAARPRPGGATASPSARRSSRARRGASPPAA